MTKHTRKISPEQMEEIVRRIRSGERPGSIAHEYGVSRQAVFNRLKFLSDDFQQAARLPGVSWMTGEEELNVLARVKTGPPTGHFSWTVALLRRWVRKEYGKLLYLPRLREFCSFHGIPQTELAPDGTPVNPRSDKPNKMGPSVYAATAIPHTPLKRLKRLVKDGAIQQGPAPKRKFDPSAPPPKFMQWKTPLPGEKPRRVARGRPPRSEKDTSHKIINDAEMQKLLDEHKKWHQDQLALEKAMRLADSALRQVSPKGKHSKGGSNHQPKKKRRK